MGPKQVEKVRQSFAELEEEVFAYIVYLNSLQEAQGAERILLEAEPVELPEAYAFYLRVKQFTGPSPQFVSGGYFDQPLHLVSWWEACKRGEERARDFITRTKTSAEIQNQRADSRANPRRRA